MFRRSLICLLAVPLLHAEKPVLDSIYPAGSGAGSSQLVTLSGKFEPWPPQVWIHPPGVTFLAETNKGKFQVQIEPDALPGPRLVRIFNADGSSEPRFFVVGAGPELDEVEPNNNFAQPQNISTFPVTVNGRLNKNNDVDSYSIHIKTGEWLDAQLDSYELMSPVDPVLRLVDTEGNQLAFNHDFASLDPRLVWRSPLDQTVVLQVFGFLYPANNSVRLSGGDNTVYRLHLQTGETPPLHLTTPSGEREPNDTSESAQSVSIPATVHGRIDTATDEDQFAFEALKGDVFAFQVEAAAHGSVLDAVLRLHDSNGKELARNDDAENSPDPKLEWTAPEEGRYFAVVTSLTHRGGPEHHYAFTGRKVEPDFEASIAASSVALKPGGTNELKLNVKLLRGYAVPLTASFPSLPEGVACAPVEVPAKGGEVTLSLKSETNAPAWNGPIQVALKPADEAPGRTAEYSFISRSQNNGVPGGYTRLLIENTDLLWLTVLPHPE